MRKLWVALSPLVLALISCAHEPAATSNSASPPVLEKDGTKLSDNEAQEAKIARQEACFPLKIAGTPPVFLSAQQIIVTRVAKPCHTPDGQPGFESDTSWMAMGFPCSGGGGVIEYRDHFTNPKIVSFQIPNSCRQSPEAREEVEKIGVEVLGLRPEAKLLAYYPLAIQYWELVDYPDADVGYAVDLRTPKSRSEGWTKFWKKEAPLRVRLFGHENAWVKDNRLYQVDAELVYTGREKFSLQVVNAFPLSPEEASAVRSRCEALRPMRNCQEVFF